MYRQLVEHAGYHYQGVYSLDEAHRVLCDNTFDLTLKEYQLALQLFSHHGSLLSRKELLESVWGVANEIDTRTVDAHIGKLRRKMQLIPEQGWQITTLHGYGYRLERVDALGMRT